MNRPLLADNLAALPIVVRRERDALWCRALVATLDAEEVESVVRWFNEHRPDVCLFAPLG